jgi:predicted amidophosphoribosyltransferase
MILKMVLFIIPTDAHNYKITGTLKQLALNLLTTTIVAPPSNASKWQMGFNSARKGLTTTIVAPPSNASKWQMGFNSAFKFPQLLRHVSVHAGTIIRDLFRA